MTKHLKHFSELDHYSSVMGVEGIPFDVLKLEELMGTFTARTDWKSEHQRKYFMGRLRGLINALDFDGRLHPLWLANGAESGRWTSRNPSMQNLSSEFQACLSSSVKSIDISQFELYVAAKLANQTWWVEAYESGQDMHQAIADRLEVDRKVGKLLNLANLYGATAHGVASRLDCSLEFAEAALESWWMELSAVQQYRDEVVGKALSEQGQVRTQGGHLRRVNLSSDKAHKRIWAHKIQGTAADVMKRAFLQMWKCEAHVIAVVHDEFWTYPAFVQFAIDSIESAGQEFGFKLRVAEKSLGNEEASSKKSSRTLSKKQLGLPLRG